MAPMTFNISQKFRGCYGITVNQSLGCKHWTLKKITQVNIMTTYMTVGVSVTKHCINISSVS